MSGRKWLWWIIPITILINLSTVGWAGIRFAEKPTRVHNKNNWKLFYVNFRVDKDWGDPKTERKRPFKWEVGLYDNRNKLKKIISKARINFESEEDKRVKEKIEVQESGEYKITVNIEYADGKPCSEGQCSQSYESDLFTVKRSPTRIFAIIIGIDRYKDDNIDNLHFPDDDADSIEQFLVEVLGVPHKQIKKLTSEKASKPNIRDAIKDIKKEVTVEDILIVYYSGHGVLYEKYFFFAPYDTIRSFNSEFFNDEAYISLHDWNLWLKTYAKHLILIQDSCFSGALIDDAVGRIWNNIWKKDFGSKTRHAILASLPSQKAYEVYLAQNGILQFATRTPPTPENMNVNGHGLFTYALLHAIEKIIAEHKIRIDLNHDKKCGGIPCTKAEERVASKIKENETKIDLFSIYRILADFMEQFTSQHKEEMNEDMQEPMYSGDVAGKVPTLMHHELLPKGQ